MFRKSLRTSYSIAAFGALWLSTISISAQRLAPKLQIPTASSESSLKLSIRNTQFDVPLRGHRLVLHGYLPAEISADAPVVLYNSGSGGWHDFDRYVATTLAKRGLPVFGVSTHSYLRDFFNDEHPATFAAVAEDYLELIKQAKEIAKVDDTRPVILAGWSLGAGYAPLVASDPRIKPEVLGVIALSLSRDNETALTVSHRLMSRLMGRTYGPSFDVSQYLARVAPVPVAIIQAAKDRTASPGQAQQLINGVSPGPGSTMRLFQVTAGRTHAFAGGRPEVDQTLDEVITWFRAQGRRS